MLKTPMHRLLMLLIFATSITLAATACGDLDGEDNCDPELDGDECVCDDPEDTSTCFFEDGDSAEDVLLDLLSDGFESSTVTINAADTLIITNRGTAQSSLTCTGDNCADVTMECTASATCGFGLDQAGNEDNTDAILEADGEVTVTFAQEGTYTFNDRINSAETLTVTVE